MTLEEIQNLTYLNCLGNLLLRVFNSSVRYEIDSNDTLSDYERVVILDEVIKPTEQELLDELALYKFELESIENARLTRINHQERFDALGVDAMSTMQASNNYRANLKAFRKWELVGITKNNTPGLSIEEAETLITLLESNVVAIKAIRIKREEANNRKEQGKAIMKLTNDVMETIIGFNLENGADIDALAVKFADILALLQRWQPYGAKTLIQAITPDEDVTQDMLDEILENYNV